MDRITDENADLHYHGLGRVRFRAQNVAIVVRSRSGLFFLATFVSVLLPVAGFKPASAQSILNLRGFDYTTRQSLELSCMMSKLEGPAAYGRCLNDQIDALRDSPGVPDLSRLDYTTRQSLELACMMSKIQGPASYGRCLNEQLNALQHSPPLPSLSGLDNATRESIELACMMQKLEGPVAYGGCLRAQLHSIGVQPNGPAPPSQPPLPPSVRSTIVQAPVFSEETPETPFLAWADVNKPSMPSNLRTDSLSPDALFSTVEKSVYVLVSAPSEQSLRNKAVVSQGSAVAVTSGIALTNCHVLDRNTVHFLVKGQTVFEVSFAYGDRSSDRCALEVQSGALTPVRGIRPYSNLAVGQRVFTVGSPSGLENTLGEGIVSGLRSRSGIDLVQTSAPISAGSSGGGLFDAAGNLIGITTFLLRDSQNLNFAIAADAFWQ